ncbi:MAG: DUF2505 domain-containing protein [Nakamurella sp.]
MPTDLTVTEEFTATSAAVYALITDASFLEARMVAGGGLEPKVISVETVDGVTTVVTQQSIPADALPSMVASMLGGDPVTERTEAWRADGDSYTADFSLTVKGAPASAKGTMRLAATGTGSALTVNATANVPIPMFGAKLESVISEQITTVLTTEGDYTRSRLA